LHTAAELNDAYIAYWLVVGACFELTRAKL
jgi:hypothetical protein